MLSTIRCKQPLQKHATSPILTAAKPICHQVTLQEDNPAASNGLELAAEAAGLEAAALGLFGSAAPAPVIVAGAIGNPSLSQICITTSCNVIKIQILVVCQGHTIQAQLQFVHVAVHVGHTPRALNKCCNIRISTETLIAATAAAAVVIDIFICLTTGGALEIMEESAAYS